MVCTRPLAAAALLLSLAACAPTVGTQAPGLRPVGSTTFSAADFAWSQAPGRGAILGQMTYRQGQMGFTCAEATVVLTPETPWVSERMSVLYGSGDHSALPADAVRARTPQAPAGDSTPFIQRTTCDSANRFSFSGLPNGVWYVITIAKPASGENTESIALMRRVVVRAGRPTNVEL